MANDYIQHIKLLLIEMKSLAISKMMVKFALLFMQCIDLFPIENYWRSFSESV